MYYQDSKSPVQRYDSIAYHDYTEQNATKFITYEIQIALFSEICISKHSVKRHINRYN